MVGRVVGREKAQGVQERTDAGVDIRQGHNTLVLEPVKRNGRIAFDKSELPDCTGRRATSATLAG